MQAIATAISTARGYLGPEMWFLSFSFLVGCIMRGAKVVLPTRFVPTSSGLVGSALGLLLALLAHDSIPADMALGAAAGAVAIGGHEFLKKAITWKFGDRIAELILGTSADKPDAPPAPAAAKP